MKDVELYRSKPFGFRNSLTGNSLWNLLGDELDVFFNSMGSSKNDIAFMPRANIEEKNDSYTLTFDLPGVKKDDVKIDVQNRTVTVSGQRKHESEDSNGGYRRYECATGEFERSFTVPDGVDADRVDASLSDGVLKLVLPKAEIKKSREIPIKTSG